MKPDTLTPDTLAADLAATLAEAVPVLIFGPPLAVAAALAVVAVVSALAARF